LSRNGTRSEAAAKALAQRVHFANASSDAEFDTAFVRFSEEHINALIVSNDAFFNSAREHIVALAAQHRVPTIYDRREYSLAGGLLSYGTSYSAAYYELGTYTGKILKGTPPGDLPVEQATKFELVINLKTANSLALEIPQKLLALADEVIE
jgi:putative tryptophan/tyrosine transport system substrate-binding protein